MQNESLFSLFYFIFSFCIIFPVPVFELCGLTIESIFSKWLKSEEDSFITYHQRRTIATVLFQSSLPLGYILGRLYMNVAILQSTSILWQICFIGSITLTCAALLRMYNWARNDFADHPISLRLEAFGNGQSYRQIANNIDNEFKGPLKIVVKCDPTSKVVTTANWIIKTSAYTVDFAHQSDVSLQVVSSDEHQMAPDSPGGVQYLQIQVISSRPKVKPFHIRINASDFKQLQDAISRPIHVMESIQINTSLTDRFLVVFRDQVNKNPVVDIPAQVEDDCWGCSVKRPNVKLVRTCGDSEGPEPCSSCYCKVMWCLDCMGTWFASRQDPDRPDLWMSSKCPCPICRSSFCVLDVCLINEVNE